MICYNIVQRCCNDFVSSEEVHMENINVREQFLSKFTVIVSNNFDIETSRQIYTLLGEFMSDYEITNRETEIVLYTDYIPHWLEEYFVAKCVRGCKDNSMKDYATHLNALFEFFRMPINEITENDIQKYIGFCLRTNHNSKCYVEHKRIIINDFFNWSVARGYLNYNPCASIPALIYNRTERVPYTDDELSTIRNEVDNLRDKAMIETFISTACRVEELCRLNITDIDFYEGTVHLFGKGDKHRTSFMNAEMKHAIIKYLETRNDTNPALFVGNRISRETKQYERVTTHGVQAVMRRLSDSIGVANIQPHRFRRTTATNMSNSGCNLSDIQRFLGHTTPTVTARYIYNDEDNLKMAHKKFVK